VSCESRLGKGSGLWARTQDVLGVAPEQIVHFGDNPVDDVEKARAQGVAAFAYAQRDAGLLEIKTTERRLRETVAAPVAPAPDEVPGTSGLYAMRGKVAARPDPATGREPYWRYGATVLGPVLSGFAQWVVREAARAGSAAWRASCARAPCWPSLSSAPRRPRGSTWRLSRPG
jgi:hypothetical protein